MKQQEVVQLSESLVRTSAIKPSKEFGPLVPMVDHVVLGEKAREFRIKSRVKANKVAEILGISKVSMSFLENGKRRWSSNMLQKYIRAVLRARRLKSETVKN